MLKKPQAFLIDVDRTLTAFDHLISERTIRVLAALAKQGFIISLCTGRTYAAIKNYVLPKIPAGGFHIVAGGAKLINSAGQTQWSKIISDPLSKKIYQHFLKLIDNPEASFNIGVGETFYVSSSYFKSHKRIMKYWSIDLADLAVLDKWEPSVINVTNYNQDFMEYLNSIKNQINFKAMINSYGANYVDLTPAGVNKATGALIWSKMQKIDLKNVIAIGDSANDLEIIQAAGYGVAMANASDDLKAAADEVIGHADEEGVAVYLERFINT